MAITMAHARVGKLVSMKAIIIPTQPSVIIRSLSKNSLTLFHRLLHKLTLRRIRLHSTLFYVHLLLFPVALPFHVQVPVAMRGMGIKVKLINSSEESIPPFDQRKKKHAEAMGPRLT